MYVCINSRNGVSEVQYFYFFYFLTSQLIKMKKFLSGGEGEASLLVVIIKVS